MYEFYCLNLNSFDPFEYYICRNNIPVKHYKCFQLLKVKTGETIWKNSLMFLNYSL